MDGQVAAGAGEAPADVDAPRQGGWWDLTKQMFMTYIVVSTLTSFMMGRRGGPEQSSGPVITADEARLMSATRSRQQMQQQEMLNSFMGGKAAVNVGPAALVFPTVTAQGLPLGPHECLIAQDALLHLQVFVNEHQQFDPKLHLGSLVFDVPSIAYNWSYTASPSASALVPVADDWLSRNGSLYAHVFLIPEGDSISAYDRDLLVPSQDGVVEPGNDNGQQEQQLPSLPLQMGYLRVPLVRFRPQPRPKALRHLLNSSAPVFSPSSSSKDKLAQQTQANATDDTTTASSAQDLPLPYLAYWTPTLNLSLILSLPSFPRNSIPAAISSRLSFTAEGAYRPVLYHNSFWQLAKNLPLVNSSIVAHGEAEADAGAGAGMGAGMGAVSRLHLDLSFSHLSFLVWQLQTSMESQWASQQASGLGTEKEADMLREMLLETSPWLLVLTGVVSLLHTVFDMLAFKNDVQFWRSKKSMAGMSLRRCVGLRGLRGALCVLCVC